ncbi:MAG TPA: arginine--tRNA ligase [Verrucomicrobiae bacterium]|nr:arginine--tRNA ligase [Verrucomicrobiae bacterium]
MPDLASLFAHALRQSATAMGAPDDVDPSVGPSSDPAFGDLSSPLAQRLARHLHRPPPAIAAELAARVSTAGIPHVAEVTVSGPGYVNLRFDDATYAPAVIAEAIAGSPDRLQAPAPERTAKTIVEHTQVNPNKAAHVGHLRNACIGDAVARILRVRGVPVEVQNYIDDTGVQVADVVVGLSRLGLTPGPQEPFDRYCSRVYVEICRRYESEPDLLAARRATLQAIESRTPPVAAQAREITERIVTANLATMARLGIDYDLLTWESDILELGFWTRALATMRRAGILEHPQEGPLAGCWVLPAAERDPGGGADGDQSGAGTPSAKVLVKSDGVATYTAKDIANHLWKFGLLDTDFHYRPWTPGGPASTGAEAGTADLPPGRFGHAERVINVIDQRQSAPQLVVRAALRRLGYTRQAAALHHLAYEVVALSPAAARSLGVDTEDGRTMYAMSGRQGLDVPADRLIDEVVRRVSDKAKDPATAGQLAAAAVRYYLLRFSLGAIITFDFDEALRTTGDTGVYLEYAHARACGILARVAPAPPVERAPQMSLPERQLVTCIARFPTAVADAAHALAPGLVATYAFQLASAFNDFYEHTPRIYRIEDPSLRSFRRSLADAARATLAASMEMLGIVPLERI